MNETGSGRRPSLWVVIGLAVLFGGVGTFAGNWAWQVYTEKHAADSAAAAKLAEEEERKSPKGRQREVVKLALNDPASAMFRNEAASKSDPNVWCGEVNGRNRMNAYVGWVPYLAFLDRDGKTEKDFAEIAPQGLSTERGTEELKRAYKDMRDSYCAP